MKIRGSWALVTGGAKRLGKGIALGLARAGANIVVHHGHSPEDAARTIGEIEATGAEAWAHRADLRRPEAIETMFAEIGTRCGALGILVNSAASFLRQSIGEITVDDYDQVMALNLRAPWLCLRHAARLMASNTEEDGERGVVVNIADLTGVRAWPGYTHHGVSKAGLIHLTRVAARELAPSIRVNCVVPGAILPPPGMSGDDPLWEKKRLGVPLQRTGSTEVIADAVVFLARNPFISGAVLPVDGAEHLLGGAPTEDSESGGQA